MNRSQCLFSRRENRKKDVHALLDNSLSECCPQLTNNFVGDLAHISLIIFDLHPVIICSSRSSPYMKHRMFGFPLIYWPRHPVQAAMSVVIFVLLELLFFTTGL